MSELSDRLNDIAGLTLTSVHMGLEEVGEKNNKYLQDKWTVTVSYKDHSYSTQYSAGIGHRKLITSVKKERNQYWNNITHSYKNEREACNAQWLKLIPPTLSDVMYCLLVDARCVEGTFEDYCSEFGIDSDSRKALDVYLACQETRTAIIKMLGSVLFTELSSLEH